jgi:surface protein
VSPPSIQIRDEAIAIMGTSSYGVECPPIAALHVSRVQTQVCSARLGSRGTTMAMLLAGLCLLTSASSLTMAAVIDLATTASPYSGATAGNADDTNVCGSGPEQGFSYLLAPGHGITIGQTANSFDSMHTLRHGGQYPGEVSVGCIEDPEAESQKMEFTNEGVEDVTVYFIVDATRSGEAGAFTLEWWFYYTAGQNQTKTTTHLWNPEPRPRPSRILLVYEPLSDSNIKDAANLWVSNQPSAIATYGAVDTWDLSQVTSLENLWCGYDVGCSKEYIKMQSFNGDLRWDVSEVINMASTFSDAYAFNGDISGWDVSKVTSMYASKSMRIFENDLT